MSKVIQVLEAMAQEANVDIEQLLTIAEIDSTQAEAIVTKDITSLKKQLDICPDFVCALIPAEDDEAEKEEDKNEDDVQAIANA